jgi:hypothetical protein
MTHILAEWLGRNNAGKFTANETAAQFVIKASFVSDRVGIRATAMLEA